MQRVLACLALVLAVSMGAAPPSRAADNDDASALPVIINLGCVPRCAAIAEPVPDKETYLNVEDLGGPDWYFGAKPVDGLVELQYIVTADGHVGDIMVTRLIGPQKYADQAKNALKIGLYKPATMDGIAINRDYTSVMKFYSSEGVKDSTHSALKASAELIKDKKLSEAEAKLEDIKTNWELSFYDRSAIANLEAYIALQQGNYAKARRLLEAPVFFAYRAGQGNRKVIGPLIRMRLVTDLNVGDLQDAEVMLAYQQDIRDRRRNDPLVKEVDKLKATIDGAAAFTVEAEIPPAGEGDSVVFGLYRRTIAIRKVTGGTLDKMIIRCRQQSVESDVSQRAEWHIPKDWNDCQVTIRGTADTKFQIVQFAN